jgi:hypothetical protein
MYIRQRPESIRSLGDVEIEGRRLRAIAFAAETELR